MPYAFGLALPGGVLYASSSRLVLALRASDGSLSLEEAVLPTLPSPLRPFLSPFLLLWAFAWGLSRLPDVREARPLEVLLSLFLLLLLFPLFLLAFFLFPLWAAHPFLPYPFLYYAVLEGAFLLPLLLYLRLPPFRPLFRYHGAEHQVAWLMDRGLPLTLEAARQQPLLHSRCGSLQLFLLFLLLPPLYALFLPPPPEPLPALLLLLPLSGLAHGAHRLLLGFPSHPLLPLQAFLVARPGEEELAVALAAARRLLGIS